MKERRVNAESIVAVTSLHQTMARQWSVTVDEHARLTREQAVTILELGQGAHYILRVRIGPRNGWKDPVVVRSVEELAIVTQNSIFWPSAYFAVRSMTPAETCKLFTKYYKY